MKSGETWNKAIEDFFYEYYRWITRLGLAAMVSILVLQRFIPDVIPQLAAILTRVPPEFAVAFALFFILLERIVATESLVRNEIGAHKTTFFDATREEANERVRALLAKRAAQIGKVDLLQFSGTTVMPIIKDVVKNCPGATIRLLVAHQDVMEGFDEPGKHALRFRFALDELANLKKSFPNMKVQIWRYTTPPAMDGILIDDWLVSVAWYHVRTSSDPNKRPSLTGHEQPAITAVGAGAELLSLMVRQHFEGLRAVAGQPQTV